MIISTSDRTDIPAFYSEWFLNRIKAGYVLVRNPFNAHQISKVSLSPDVVDCIVFWSKNPRPLMKRLDELKDYNYYFQFTLTGYGRDIEPAVPDKYSVMIPTFQELSERIGTNRVIWRYDPIIFTDEMTPEYHLEQISRISEALDGYTKKCVISFVDWYGKVKKTLEDMNTHDLSGDELLDFAGRVHKITSSHHMVTASCAEKADLASVGIEHNSCVDKHLVEEITGAIYIPEKKKPNREACGCIPSIDIGLYDTCLHLCKYCYANSNPDVVRRMRERYDPESPILCGTVGLDDKITERKVKSDLDRQLTFDFLK